MKLEQLTPIPGLIGMDGPEGLRDYFAGTFWTAPSFLLNVVANKAGQFTGATGSSRDISNELDYQALIGFRKAADGILTTAHTARIEQYRRSRYAPLALVSRSGDFSGIPAVEIDTAGPIDSKVYLLVTRGQLRSVKARYTSPWIQVVSIGSGSTFRLSFALTRIGWRKILVEAGPTFSSYLISRSVIRGIALSITDAGESSPLEAAAAALQNLGVVTATLESADRVEGTLFTRWTDIHPQRRS